jgi:hypothetical protein
VTLPTTFPREIVRRFLEHRPHRQTHFSIQIKFVVWSTVCVVQRFCYQGDYSVAVATKTQGKTSFVRNFLENNPQANAKAVNEAWAAAGMKGMISHPIVSEMRKRLGLIGNQPGKTKTPAKAKPAAKKSKPVLIPGKAMFVKEFLNDHPEGNVRAINEAWRAAGFNGAISKTVVFKVKAAMGLTGDIRANTKKTKTSAAPKTLVTPRNETTATVKVQPRVNRSTVLDDIEADIDRLLFKVMGIGNLNEIEDSLRQVRRLLYRTLTTG